MPTQSASGSVPSRISPSICVAFFRVRVINCREISIRSSLLVNDGYVPESELLQRLRYKRYSGAMDRRVNYFQVLLFFDYLRVNRKRLKHLYIFLIDLLADN